MVARLAVLLLVCIQLGSSITVGDDYDWFWKYDGDWRVIYGCWMPAVEGLEVRVCEYDTDRQGDNYGCCLHFNQTGHEHAWLTCALHGTVCPDGGVYLVGNHTHSWPTTGAWNFNGSTIGLDEHEFGSDTLSIALGCTFGGMLLIVAAVVCCCKCTSCGRTRDDDAISLMSHDGPIILPSPPKPAARSPMNHVVQLDSRHMHHTSHPNGLPSYEQIEREDRMKGQNPPV